MTVAAAARLLVACAVVLCASPARALLFGENARAAPRAPLQIALRMYKKGADHGAVWKKTGWFCFDRKAGGCRFELPHSGCYGPERMNLIQLDHTGFVGEVPLWKVFNAACVWSQYPALRKKIYASRGECRGAYGLASHDGEIGRVCVNLDKIRRDAARGEDVIYRVFLHEIQHQIQYAENWPRPRHDCGYDARALEQEARIVERRSRMDKKTRKNSPPNWPRGALCF